MIFRDQAGEVSRKGKEREIEKDVKGNNY